MKILITGATGFLGHALVHRLTHNHNVISVGSKPIHTRDLRNRNNVDILLSSLKPDVIINLAAKVGGIGENMQHPGEFFYDNMIMGLNVIDAARCNQVKKFIQIGTVCSYPKFTPVPFKEENIWEGYPEETNAPYGIAKKALLVMLQGYRQQYNFNGIYLIPVNLYGPHDNFNLDTGHVIPSLIRKIVAAKKYALPKVEIWGTGTVSREFLYVDECARAIELAMNYYNGSEPVNIGSGHEMYIRDLAYTIKKLLFYNGDLIWNTDKPDGQPRRCLDTTKAYEFFKFNNETSFEEGLNKTIRFFEYEYGDVI